MQSMRHAVAVFPERRARICDVLVKVCK